MPMRAFNQIFDLDINRRVLKGLVGQMSMRKFVPFYLE